MYENQDATNLATLQELIEQGFNLAQEANYQEALTRFTQAITLDPNCTVAYMLRGATHFQSGDRQGAYRDYEQAAQLYDLAFDRYFYAAARCLLNKKHPLKRCLSRVISRNFC